MVYRDELAALEDRRALLQRELEDLDATSHDLLARRALCEAELASVRAALDGAHRTLPLLDRLQVASPCHVSWGAMQGDARVRFCGVCGKNVFNLSAMSRAEAEALLRREAGICARMYRRTDGTVLTADCPVGVRKRRVRGVVALAAAGAALGGPVLWTASTFPEVKVVSLGQMVADGASLVGHPVRTEGTLVHGSLTKQQTPCEYRFRLSANGVEVPVRYAQCVVPDNFRDLPGWDIGVLVEGEWHTAGLFEAKELLARGSQGAVYTVTEKHEQAATPKER
jgi:cytochrome c-type biogenesis protein CcmE